MPEGDVSFHAACLSIVQRMDGNCLGGGALAIMLQQLMHNIAGNLFKPLLLFFYAGFLIPILRVKFEFPKPVYQALTIFLLLSIGWHGGGELAHLHSNEITQAAGFILLGFFTNMAIGFTTYFILSRTTRLRKIDSATIAGYYGSDSAGTFVTALGVLTAAHIAFAPYMPVLLAVMEIPGCLVALFLVNRLREKGMDVKGNMPGEPGFVKPQKKLAQALRRAETFDEEEFSIPEYEEELVGAGHGRVHRTGGYSGHSGSPPRRGRERFGESHDALLEDGVHERLSRAEQLERELEAEMSAELKQELSTTSLTINKKKFVFNTGLMHEVFFNPGIFLLFAGVAIGFLARIQGDKVAKDCDALFDTLFPGLLCLFLLEMGMTASKRLKDLRLGGLRFVAFALLAPNLFAFIGISLAHGYSCLLGQPFDVGTYVLFAVLCGAASYIAMPAVQRLAVPEASPTLPLAASLGVTFTYNVTIGIPVYIAIATGITHLFPVA